MTFLRTWAAALVVLLLGAASVRAQDITQFSPTIFDGGVFQRSAGNITLKASGVTNAMLAGSISASKLVGTDIAALGTVITGTWNAAVIPGQYGGTGIANTGKTITLGGNLVTSGAFATTLTVTGVTNVTLPTTGTLATLAGAETLSNKTVSGGTLSGTTTLTGMTTGSVLFAGAASALSQDNANLFWDDSTNRLGVGTATPGNTLEVAAASAIAAIYDTAAVAVGVGGELYFSAKNNSSARTVYASSKAHAQVGTAGSEAGSLRFRTKQAGTLTEGAVLYGSNLGLGNFSAISSGVIPQVNLHVGITAGTARTYNTFTDLSNGEWAYLGDWGASANVATFGTAKNGTGAARNVSFVRDSTAYLQLVAAGSQFTGLVGIGQAPAAQLDLGGNVSAAAWTTNGIGIRARDATYTDTTSSGGPLANVYIHRIGVPTIAASSAITYTAATTFNINGPPVAGTNVTITTPYSLRVATGNSLFGGTLSATAFLVGAVAGVSCSGAPTAGFTSVNGIVTAC